MWRARTALVLISGTLAAALALCPAAGASSVVRLYGEAQGNPAWSGDRLLALVEQGGHPRLRSIDPETGSATTLTSVNSRRTDYLALDASPSLVLVHAVDIRCYEEGCKYEHNVDAGEEVLFGAPGSPLSCAAGFGDGSCGGMEACYGAQTALVAENRLAFSGCDNLDRGTTIVLDESSAPPGRTVVPQIGFPEAMAGHWLVGLSADWTGERSSALIEINLRTGEEALASRSGKGARRASAKPCIPRSRASRRTAGSRTWWAPD
jgi:hypothetical protein